MFYASVVGKGSKTVKTLYREYLRLKRLHPDDLLLFYYGQQACDFLGYDARVVAQYAPKCVIARDKIRMDAILVEIVYARWADGQLVHQLLTAGHRVAVCRLQQNALPDPLTNIPSLEQLPLIRKQIDGKVDISP